MAKSIARFLVAVMAVAAMALASAGGMGLAQAQTNTSTDRAALVALYNATDGANWHNNDNWLSNAPMGEWHGVTTDSDGRVTRLDLRYNQLTGEIPAELGSLAGLEWLYLDNNQLTGEIPAELGSLTNLRVLWLAGNQLTGEIPAELGSLTNLERLFLGENQLTGCIPGGLRDVPLNDLTQLGLDYCMPVASAGDAATDRAALVALYNATDGANWRNKGNWLSDAPMGEWHGVTTDSDGRVTDLSLSFNQLTGEIPAELGYLTNLTHLSLSGNRLTGEIPAELGDLSSLTALQLRSNQLTGEIPAELGSLTSLQSLWLQENQLTGEIPAELGSLTNLTHLYLFGNQLTGEIPAELGSLTSLTELELRSNQLTGEIPAELGDLSNLEGLSLFNNQLTGEIPAELGNLTNLTDLSLSVNQLTGEIPAELGSLTSLKYLRLDRNQLTGEIPAELGDLSNLTELQLRSNQLTGEIPAELVRLPNLHILFLDGNQLTGAIPAELGSLTNLTHLSLSVNQLTGEIPAELGSLTSLKYLRLDRNQLTGEIPAELGSLTSLIDLYLDRNQLTGKIPAELGSLTSLKYLRLDRNQLTGEIPAELGSLTSLIDLYLYRNQLTGCIPGGLRDVPVNDLAQLGLDYCMPGAPTVSRVSPTSSSLTLETGDSRTFTARATDPDSNITSYEWTVNGRGVGNSGTLTDTGDVSQTFTHTFASSGTYTVRVEFTDSDGASGSTSWRVEVSAPSPPPPTSNRAPTVTIVSPAVSPATSTISLAVGDAQTFQVRATDSDDNLMKWKWVVDKHGIIPFVDDHQEPEASFASTGRITKSFSHTFPDDGTYTVTVTFTDSEGLTGAAEWTVEVFDGPVSLICGVEPIGSSSSALVAGQLVRTFAEVTAREDLTDIYVQFRAFHPGRGFSDEARSDKKDIGKDDTAKLGVPGVFIPGDGFILECTVKDAGFFGVIDPLDKTLASRQSEPFSLGPYSVSGADRDKVRGWLRSCESLDTLIERGSQVTFTPKITQNNRHRANENAHPFFRAHVNVYKDGERVWRFDTGDKQGPADLTQYDLGSKSFTPSEPGGYAYDCVLTSRQWRENAFVSVVSKLPGCVLHDPITLTLCAIVFVHELANLYQYDWSLSSTFCVGGYPDCPFTYDTGSNISPPSVRVGEPVSLSFRTSGLNGVADHGGVTMSFPDLMDVGTTSADHEYVSDKASVSTVSYTTGKSNVTYHRTGASVQTAGGTPGTANYLLVESDDSSWPSGADRTLELELTPWEPGTFRVQYRYWLCLAGYDDCRRKPESGGPDQQGWQVQVLEITVNAVPDRDELVEFYEDTDGPNWDDAAAWLSHAPLDDWRGVDTGMDDRVTVLELPSNNLSGPIPTVLGDLTDLEVLDLSRNGLTGEIPAALESLTALTTLDLSSNDLGGGIPSELGDLTALTTLDLSTNNLDGGIPSALGSLRNVAVLRLYDNGLNRPIPAELGNLTNLTELDLSGNGLSGSIPAELDKLANLQVLDLSGNRLSGAIPEGLGNLQHLDAVYLDGNRLDSGCIPATWRDVYNHDLDDVDLPFCDVALSALTVSPGELTPRFDPAVSKYTAKVEDGQVTITPATSHGGAFQLLDGQGVSVPDADGALDGHQIAVGYGDTTIKIRVVSPDGGDRHTYTVRVVWAGEPRVPAIAGITPGPSSLEVSWVMPTDIRDDYITSYNLRHIQSSAPDKADSNWTVLGDVWTSGPLGHTVMGLHAGTGYDVQLRAVTSAGVSPWSATVSGTPAEGECSTEGAVPDPVNNPGQAADCEALLEVRDALSGDGDLDWESSDPISGWDGAEVDPATGRITRLDLDGEAQPGVAPSVQAGLTRQQTAASSKDPLTGEIPAALSSLTGLEHLSLAHNQLTGRIPRELARLTELQALRLQGNQLTGRIPAELAGLSNLVELKLGQNRLTGCVPEGLLDVADNDLGQLGLPACGPAVVMSVATTSIAVRTGTPIVVTATFDEPVTGFAVGDVSVVNGSAGNFSGSDGDTVYTFDVVPDAIGAVTVDIAADAAEESGGNGNRAAPRLWLGMPYDDDGDGVIEKSEVIEAINDYLFGEGDEAISKSDVIKLINLYLFG